MLGFGQSWLCLQLLHALQHSAFSHRWSCQDSRCKREKNKKSHHCGGWWWTGGQWLSLSAGETEALLLYWETNTCGCHQLRMIRSLINSFCFTSFGVGWGGHLCSSMELTRISLQQICNSNNTLKVFHSCEREGGSRVRKTSSACQHCKNPKSFCNKII